MVSRGTLSALGALAVVVLGLSLLVSRLPSPAAPAHGCDGCPARVQWAVDLVREPAATAPRQERIPAGALLERADGTLNGYVAVRYHGQVGWVAARALEPPVPPASGGASWIDALAQRPPLWLSGLLAVLGLGRRRPTAAAGAIRRTEQARRRRARAPAPAAAAPTTEPALLAAIARQILLGARESVTIASRLGRPAAVVNAALLPLRARCGGCIAVTQPLQSEARFTIALISRAALAQLLDE
jgi:hypothetical protein